VKSSEDVGDLARPLCIRSGVARLFFVFGGANKSVLHR
jgi:hypothetical protein